MLLEIAQDSPSIACICVRVCVLCVGVRTYETAAKLLGRICKMYRVCLIFIITCR